MNKREQRKIYTGSHYHGFELYNRTQEKCAEGFYEVMLSNTKDDLEALLSNHNKVNVVRVDLYFKKPVTDEYHRVDPATVNELMSKFFKSLKAKMVRWKKDGKSRGLKSSQIAYQYAMEDTPDKLLHVHAYIAYKGLAQQKDGERFTDITTGKKIGIYKMIEDTWVSTVPNGLGKVWFSERNCFYYLDRNSIDLQDKLEDCFYGLTYISKVYSKNTVQADNTRRYNASQRIKKGHYPIKLKGRNGSVKERELAEDMKMFEVK